MPFSASEKHGRLSLLFWSRDFIFSQATRVCAAIVIYKHNALINMQASSFL